jgi:hypothetical protein
LSNNLYIIDNTEGEVKQWDDITQPPQTMIWKSKTFITPNPVNLGAAKVVADYSDVQNLYVWESADIAWEEAAVPWGAEYALTFRLYANKTQVYEALIENSNIFRLPAGYKHDTFEVEVEGALRIRSVHLADTPQLLQTV